MDRLFLTLATDTYCESPAILIGFITAPGLHLFTAVLSYVKNVNFGPANLANGRMDYKFPPFLPSASLHLYISNIRNNLQTQST
jgi:hypothetical protein